MRKQSNKRTMLSPVGFLLALPVIAQCVMSEVMRNVGTCFECVLKTQWRHRTAATHTHAQCRTNATNACIIYIPSHTCCVCICAGAITFNYNVSSDFTVAKNPTRPSAHQPAINRRVKCRPSFIVYMRFASRAYRFIEIRNVHGDADVT